MKKLVLIPTMIIVFCGCPFIPHDPGNPVVTHVITASAGNNGSIEPSGTVVVNDGADQYFEITPDIGYEVNDVLVDGYSVGAVTSYTFFYVTESRTISASFKAISTGVTHAITASAGSNGLIEPSGAVTVNDGDDQYFMIIPNTGYEVNDVLVDGYSVGAVTSYMFLYVTGNHTISASFFNAGTVILLQDDFNGSIVSSGNWHIPTWVSSTDGTYVGRTQFRCTQNASLPVAYNGNAMIDLDTYNPTGASFYGTDLISNQLFTFGQGIIVTVRAKMDTPIPGGIVCGIFLYDAPASSSNTLHDEIDFELLSNDPTRVWTNIYGNEPLGPGHSINYAYASGSATDYHTYQIQWLPGQVSWYIDGNLVRTVTNQSPIPVGSMYFHLNAWVPDIDFAAAYNSGLQYTTSSSANQTFSMSVDSVTITEAQ